MGMPFRMFLSLGWLLGAVLIVNGIEAIINAFTKGKKDILGCILGVIYVIAGILILFSGIQRILTDILLAYMIGFSLIFSGIIQGIGVFKAKRKGGVAVAMISVGYLIGASIMMQGINTTILAWSYEK